MLTNLINDSMRDAFCCFGWYFCGFISFIFLLIILKIWDSKIPSTEDLFYYAGLLIVCGTSGLIFLGGILGMSLIIFLPGVILKYSFVLLMRTLILFIPLIKK